MISSFIGSGWLVALACRIVSRAPQLTGDVPGARGGASDGILEATLQN